MKNSKKYLSAAISAAALGMVGIANADVILDRHTTARDSFTVGGGYTAGPFNTGVQPSPINTPTSYGWNNTWAVTTPNAPSISGAGLSYSKGSINIATDGYLQLRQGSTSADKMARDFAPANVAGHESWFSFLYQPVTVSQSSTPFEFSLSASSGQSLQIARNRAVIPSFGVNVDTIQASIGGHNFDQVVDLSALGMLDVTHLFVGRIVTGGAATDVSIWMDPSGTLTSDYIGLTPTFYNNDALFLSAGDQYSSLNITGFGDKFDEFAIASVPEPATLALNGVILLAVGGGVLYARRKNKAQ